jgi:hypothetical protein
VGVDTDLVRSGGYDGVYRVIDEHNGWPILQNQAGVKCFAERHQGFSDIHENEVGASHLAEDDPHYDPEWQHGIHEVNWVLSTACRRAGPGPP